MTFRGFNEDDYEYMRKPGSKMQLTEMNGLRHICTVVSFDEDTQCVTLKYERNQFMSQELLDRLRDDEFEIDLREYQHQWINPSEELYCMACHSMVLDHLFVCRHESHGKIKVAFHDRCLDKSLGHVIPNNNNQSTWTCPIHSNLMQKIDPSTLRKRRGDYDFAFDRPQKKRKIVISDPEWLNLPEGVDPVYPIHESCQYCYVEGVAAECDGFRPCGNCAKYVEEEILDLSDPKYISMNEQELRHEIDLEAEKYCNNRDCTFNEFENDQAMQRWLEMHNTELYHKYCQEKREKDQQKMDDKSDDDEDIDLQKQHEDKLREQGIKEREKEEIIHHEFKEYKQPEFVDVVPIYARYQCPECNELFGDKYRYKMHTEWAHQKVMTSKAAISKDSEWKVLNHFKSEKPLKYACPYAGCLRGANSSDEIEDHILRHHDITDPTKPKAEPIPKKKDNKKGKAKKKMADIHQDDVYAEGIAYLSQREKGKISKIWVESTSQQIDRKNRQDLIKNFVSAIVDDNLDRFDKVTKRLQREYKENMERLANARPHGPHGGRGHSLRHLRQDIPPPLTSTAPVLEKEEEHSGPRSLWG